MKSQLTDDFIQCFRAYQMLSKDRLGAPIDCGHRTLIILVCILGGCIQKSRSTQCESGVGGEF